MPTSKKPRDFSKLPLAKTVTPSTESSTSTRRLLGALVVPISMVVPNRQQVRQDFKEESLQELAEDIKVRGILEPLIVRESQPGEYEIVAGERRYKAAEKAGLKELPVIVQELDDTEARYVTLVENIQREDLSHDDEKRFFQQLQAEFNFSISDIAKLINKSVSYVSRRLNGVEEQNETISDSNGKNSENSNNLFNLQRLSNKSQSVGKTNQKDFKWKPNTFKSTHKVLENTIILLDGEMPPDKKTKSQIRQEIETLEQKLAEIKERLAE